MAAIAALLLAAVGAVAPEAEAGLIFGTGTDTGFTGEILVESALGTTATIRITLNNTSPFDARITGFGFTSPAGTTVTGGTLTVLSGTIAPGDWELDLGSQAATAGRTVDIAGITGPNFLGGDANSGIPNEANDPGTANPAVFRLSLTGTGLTPANLNQTSIETAGDDFLVRFQRTGPRGQDSDVVVAQPQPVPEPSSVALALSGLLPLGVAGLRWLRPRREATPA